MTVYIVVIHNVMTDAYVGIDSVWNTELAALLMLNLINDTYTVIYATVETHTLIGEE